ncbi:MAG: IclR family transcriptional regulator [Moraxella sp.]|jgi:DNA-binding IclR family transcriptional regulator
MARVSSITRVLQIIEAVSAAQRALSPLDLSEILDIPKPTMHRLIQQLQEEGFVRVDLNGTIVPASRTRHMAIHLWQSQQVAIQRHAILQKLVDKIGETCGMAVPYYVNMVYTDRVACPSALQVYMPTDSTAPMWCTAAGKVYLSTLPKEERASLIKHLPLTAITPATLTEVGALNQSIDQTANQQYGVSDEEYIEQTVSVAVAINDTQGRYIGSLYTTAPKMRKSLADLVSFVPDMHKAAKDICEGFFESA